MPAEHLVSSPPGLGEHPRVFGAEHEDRVEAEDELGVMQGLQCGGERAGERVGLTRELVDDAPRPLAREQRDRVGAGRDPVLAGDRAERRLGVVLREAEPDLARRSVSGAVDLARSPSADVADHELEGAADRGVGTVALTQRVAPGVHPDGAGARPAAHDHRSGRHRGGEQTVDVELARCTPPRPRSAPTGGTRAGSRPSPRRSPPSRRSSSTRSGGTIATTSRRRARGARRASASPAPRSAARPVARRSSRGRTSSRCRPRHRRRRCAATRAPTHRTALAGASTRSGSTLIEPQPGRNTGRPSPRPVTPVTRSHSGRCQPTVRSTSTPSTTRSTVGTVSIS